MDRAASPVFAGRESELSQLAQAFEECLSGSLRLALISADAGGGKTRLLSQFADRVKERATVITGACTDQSESGLPFAPFTAALRGLVRDRGIGEVVGLVGTSSAGDLAWLLPEFGAPRALPDMTIVRSRLFEVLRLLTERLARQRPLVWILEDVHWADAGTRDLLRYLAANAAAVPVLLLISHRTDALHRDHPLRPVLAELSRLASARSVRLPPLSRRDVAVQLRGILGRDADPAAVGAIHTRSEGIPLYIEALIGPDARPRIQVPESVNDLLLCAVHELPLATQVALRAASLGGNAIQLALVAAVVASSAAALESDLHAALAANVLVARSDRYAFRHQLLREAIEGEMLVGERRRLHGAYAAVIAADPVLAGDIWAALAMARHWHHAAEDERAFSAAWTGACQARGANAYAEQLEMLELMLDLWPRVPNAEAVVEASHLDIIEQAANAACWAGKTERGMMLTEIGIARSREADDRERVAAFLGMQRAPMRQQQLLPGSIDDLEAALRLCKTGTRLRVECLAILSRALLVRGRLDEAEHRIDELARAAEHAGEDAGRLDARITRAMLNTRRGTDARADLDEAIERSRRLELSAASSKGLATDVAAMASPPGWLEILAMNARIEAEAAMGRHGSAANLAELAARRCLEVGQAGYIGPAIAQNHARSLQFVGRWDDAILVIEKALDAEPAPFGRAQLTLCRSEIAVLRGDQETAKRGLLHLRQFSAELLAKSLSVDRLALEILFADGETAAAVRLGDEVLERCKRATAQEAWPCLALLIRIQVAAERDLAALKPALALARQLPRPGLIDEAYAALTLAERARTNVRNSSTAWMRLAESWGALEQPFERAYALMRAAAHEPSRAAAAEWLVQAANLASLLGAQPLLQRIRIVAQRRRIVMDGGPAPNGEPVPFALTSREMEVLKLLAEGRTNQQIATTLVISAKTASVHVTNILSKLDVRTRGAAAAVAHRLGLTERR